MRNLLLGTVALSALLLTACDAATPTAPSTTAAMAKSGTVQKNGGGGGGGGGGSTTSGSTPVFLTATPGSANSAVVSFYAKVGQDRTGEIFVNGSSGGNGNRLVRLRIKKDAGITLPNGTVLASGDSVLISMQITDLTTLATHFEPAGILFTGKQVAQLAMWYHHTNASGAGNSGSLSIWKQETLTSPWEKLASTVDGSAESVSAYIPGFTNYVIAY